MIDSLLFMVLSIIFYLSIFFLIYKIALHNVIKTLIIGFIAGIYLNISENGHFTQYLGIVYSNEVSVISMIIVVVYLITGIVLFRDKNDSYD